MKLKFDKSALMGISVASVIVFGILQCGADEIQDSWRSHLKTLSADKSVVRLYPFEEGAGSVVANIAGGKEGALVLPVYSPYGLYRGFPHSPAPESVECPKWTYGRWPWKKALDCGLAEHQVCRSMFYGTPDGNFTVEAWIRMEEVGEREWVGGDLLGVGVGWGSGWRITAEQQHWCPEGNVAFVFGIPNGTVSTRIQYLPFGSWHFIAAVWDGKNIRLHVDEKVSSMPCAGPFIPSQRPKEIENDIGGLAIGGHLAGREGGLRFDIDEMVIYNRVLSPEEISGHFKSFKPAETEVAQLEWRKNEIALRDALNQIEFQFSRGSGGYFPLGKPVDASVRMPKSPLLANITSATLTVKSKETGKAIYSKQIPFNVKDGALPSSDFSFTADRCGLYSAVFSIQDAKGKTVFEKDFPLGITLPVSDEVLKKDAFILGVHHSSFPQPDARAIGATWCRIVVDWGAVEPKKGVFSWEVVDRMMDASAASKLKVLCCVTVWPGWVPLEPVKKCIPSDMTAYKYFLGMLSQRYRNQISAWEIWNAPDGPPYFKFRENAAGYGAVVEAASEVIRKESPDSFIVGSGFSAEALKFMDGVSFQSSPGPAASSKISPVPGAVGRPLWNTASATLQPAARMGELSPDAFETTYSGRVVDAGEFKAVMSWPYFVFSGRGAAVRQVRQIIMEQAAGTKAVFLSSGVNEYYPSWNTSDGTPSEKGIAIAAMMSFLSGSMSLSAAEIAGMPAISAYLISKENSSQVTVLWAEKKLHVSAMFNGNGEIKACDLFGNPVLLKTNAKGESDFWLDESPMYVLSSSKVQFSEVP